MDYWVVNIIGYSIAVLMIVVINLITHDPLCFVNIFSIIYGSAIAANQYWYGVVIESEFAPSPQTLWILFSAWWAFLLGTLIVIHKPMKKSIYIANISKYKSIMMLRFLVIANIIYTITCMYANNSFAALLQPGKGIITALAENRVDIGGYNISLGWYLELWHTAYLYYLPLALYLLRLNYLKIKTFIIIFIIAVISALSMFSRMQLLTLLTVTLFAWVILYKPRFTKIINKVLIGLVISLFIFISMQSFIDKSTSEKSNAVNTNLLDQVITYSLGPISNYQELLKGNYYEDNIHNALYTFQPLYYFLGKLGLINADEYPIRYREYVFAPFPSNVFTFLDAFTLDFGPAGAVIGTFFIGLFVAFIYRKVKEKISYFKLVLYALCVYACLIAMLANVFITQAFLIELVVIYLIQLLITSTNKSNNIY